MVFRPFFHKSEAIADKNYGFITFGVGRAKLEINHIGSRSSLWIAHRLGIAKDKIGSVVRFAIAPSTAP